jgi:ABC-type sugar transport system substrate-binding protein
MVGVLTVVAGCSSQVGESQTATGSQAPTQSQAPNESQTADAALIADAADLLSRATEGLIYSGELAPSLADITDATPSDFETVTEWAGPTQPVTPPRDKSVVMISCAAGTLCETAVESSKDLIESLDLGWTVQIINADGTPQSFASSFESALAQNPDIIFGVAVADTAVAAQLEKAKEQGIFTIAGYVQPTGDTRYDSYVSGNTPSLFALEAFSIIADSNGTASTLVVHDGSYPNLDNNATQAEALLETCGGCTVHSTDWTSEQAQNPVEAQQIISASLAANPDIDYILMPYDSLGLSATAAAARESGRDVNVVVKDGFAPALELVRSGDILFNAGFDLNWANWVAVDNMFRSLAGEDLIPEDAQGLPVRMFTADNTPEDGIVDFTEFIDYPSQYRQLWGLDGE